MQQLFNRPDGIVNQRDAENKWARAYHGYAGEAEDVSGDTIVTANMAGFRGALTLFSAGATAALTARRFESAFVSYWTGGVFGIGKLILSPPGGCPNVGGNGTWGSEVTSVVMTVVPNVLFSLLFREFQLVRSSDTAASKASAIARAFHRATTTAVKVLITGVDTTPAPTGPLPITNTCAIR